MTISIYTAWLSWLKKVLVWDDKLAALRIGFPL